MNELPDRTVILALVATLILVFILIFSTRPTNQDFQPSIEWRNETEANVNYQQI